MAEKQKTGLFIGTLYGGGAERVVSRLSQILSEEYDVYVILCEDTYMEYPYTGRLINMDIKDTTGKKISKVLNIIRRIRKLKKIKKQYQLKAVISFLDSPNLINVFSKVNGCRNIVSVRNYEFGKVTSKVKKKLYQKIYDKADLIIPVSYVIGEKIKQKYGIENRKFCVMYNPYDITEIETKANEQTEETFNDFVRGKYTFVSVGRLNHQKGYWHLLKAFSEVHKQYPSARLALFGKGELEEKIITLTEKLQLSDCVYLHGFVRNPYKYIRKCQVYVLSSLFEGFPNAMAEAMCCAVPVIATDCNSGPKEILFDNPDLSCRITELTEADYGIILPHFSEEENWDTLPEKEDLLLAEAMKKMIENSYTKDYSLLSQKARQRAMQFDYQTAKETIKKALEKCST